jgi:hypothetical protein
MPEVFDQASFDSKYGVVELAYSQGRYDEALSGAEALMQEVEGTGNRPQVLRLKLLLGHINFYGLQQPLRAGQLYRNVLDNALDPTYRDLAAQGVELTEKALQQASAPEPGEASDLIANAPSGGRTSGKPAMPWLSDDDGDVETELLDVDASADGSLPFMNSADGFGQGTSFGSSGLSLEKALPVPPPIETVNVRLVEDAAPATRWAADAGLTSLPPLEISPEEEAELMKGLLRVVLD